MIIKGIIAILLLLIVPILIGMLFSRIFKKESNICLDFVIGYLIEFSIFQIVSVPLIKMGESFKTDYNICITIICILSILSIILNIKNVKEIILKIFKSIKELPKFWFLITIFLILMQIWGLVGYMHEDSDDAVYVGTAVTSLETDTLYVYSGTSGSEQGEQLIDRYRLSPFPLLYAIISKAIDIHPTIVAHTILPAILIILAYCIYGLIANEIYNGEKKKVWQFLFITSIIYIWGNYSIRTNFTFLLFRIWQGKAVLANIIIPAVILFFIKSDKNNIGLYELLTIFITILAGNFTTTMGIGLAPITLMLIALAYEISKFNFGNLKENNYFSHIKNLFKYLACCIPSFIFAIMYYL